MTNRLKKKYLFRVFDELSVGNGVGFEFVLDEQMHNKFSKLVGDYSPIHCDEEFSGRTIFKDKIVYAFLLSSFLSRVYGMHLPGGTSVCLKQESRFIKPVYVGQKIRVQSEITSKSEATKIVEIKSEMFNEKEEKIFEGKGTVQVLFGLKNLPLYIAKKNKKIFFEDLVFSLKKGGVREGDIIFVHSDVSVFGKIGEVKNRYDFLKLVSNSLKETVGEAGTVILPTFTYSFTKNEIYSPKSTPSMVGALTEYFRRQKDTIRTIHPIFSVAIWGKEKKFFNSDLSKDSFGEKSIFGKLKQKNGKIVFLGAPFQSCTFIHYIEQLFGVPYRYSKTFSGKIETETGVYHDDYEYFVRPLGKDVRLGLDKFKEYLLEKGYMKSIKLGDGEILIIDSEILSREGIERLKEDIHFFLKNIPIGF